jgi:hypothetical protein
MELRAKAIGSAGRTAAERIIGEFRIDGYFQGRFAFENPFSDEHETGRGAGAMTLPGEVEDRRIPGWPGIDQSQPAAT